MQWRSYGEEHDEKQARKYSGINLESGSRGGGAHLVVLEGGSLDGDESVHGKRFGMFGHTSGTA